MSASDMMLTDAEAHTWALAYATIRACSDFGNRQDAEAKADFAIKEARARSATGDVAEIIAGLRQELAAARSTIDQQADQIAQLMADLREANQP